LHKLRVGGAGVAARLVVEVDDVQGQVRAVVQQQE
jgi:hypothetical protein